MARDYFSDIYADQPDPPRRRTKSDDAPAPASAPPPPPTPSQGGERSIRNISVPSRRQIPISPRVGNTDIRIEREPEPVRDVSGGERNQKESTKNSRSRWIMWGGALLSILVLGGAAFFVFGGSTTVTVTPRTHQITFDPSTQFTAYPDGMATEGAIMYTLQTTSLEDSTTVPATGTEKAQDLASGNVTVYNDYSTSPVRLIKNTRFESPDGKIFRIPASIEVPGKKGTTPGEISVTVFADQAGPEYNLPPTNKFTVPGLKGTPDMYTGVYARSSAAFSGGFVGDKPAVSPQALENARAEIRGRLQAKAAEAARAVPNGFAFPSLVRITYASLPTTPDPSGGARVSERATIQIPIFPADGFAHAIAHAVSADASESKVSLKPEANFSGKPTGELPENLGEAPLVFTLDGIATIVWEVQTQSLAEALAGREQGAFETIIGSFPGVEKAQANIAPFWSSKFPTDPVEIKIELVEPTQP